MKHSRMRGYRGEPFKYDLLAYQDKWSNATLIFDSDNFSYGQFDYDGEFSAIENIPYELLPAITQQLKEME